MLVSNLLKVYIEQKGRRRSNSFIFIIACHVVLEYESSAGGLRIIPLANMVLIFGTHLKLYHHPDPISDNRHMAKFPLVNLCYCMLSFHHICICYTFLKHIDLCRNYENYEPTYPNSCYYF